MAGRANFRNLICMADLFFALSASLFLLSAIEGKTLDGEDPLVDRDPDPAEIERAIEQLENEDETIDAQMRGLRSLVERLGLENHSTGEETEGAPNRE